MTMDEKDVRCDLSHYFKSYTSTTCLCGKISAFNEYENALDTAVQKTKAKSFLKAIVKLEKDYNSMNDSLADFIDQKSLLLMLEQKEQELKDLREKLKEFMEARECKCKTQKLES